MKRHIIITIMIVLIMSSTIVSFSHGATTEDIDFPKQEISYHDEEMTSFFDKFFYRIKEEPFNLFALLVFLMAIAHTMMTSWIRKKAHDFDDQF